MPTPPGLHPDTGLALAQPRDCLVTDDDLVRLATAEAMFRGQWEAERLRAQLADLGIERAYDLPRRRAC